MPNIGVLNLVDQFCDFVVIHFFSLLVCKEVSIDVRERKGYNKARGIFDIVMNFSSKRIYFICLIVITIFWVSLFFRSFHWCSMVTESTAFIVFLGINFWHSEFFAPSISLYSFLSMSSFSHILYHVSDI